MIDSHAHLAAPQFDTDRDEVATRSPAWIEVGTDLGESTKAVRLAERYEKCWATVGVHPDEVATLTEPVWGELEKLAEHPKVKAIGEVGFDFYRNGTVEPQEPVLRRFLSLANQKKLPVIFHVRDGKEASAHEALLTLLETLPAAQRPTGVIHTFSGSAGQAQRYLDLGLYLSFSGVLTFKKAGEILAVAKTVPLERILIETDCPFLAPEPHRGQRNEPSYIKFVAAKIAELRGISLEEVLQATKDNTKNLFQLSTEQFS
jgi:TatD DNase family protein